MTRNLLESMAGGALATIIVLLLRERVLRLGVWILTRWRLRGHVTVRDGEWNDPATWRDGRVPGDGARVVLRHRVTAPREGRVTLGLQVYGEGDGGLD